MLLLLACQGAPIALNDPPSADDTAAETDTDTSAITGPWGTGADGALVVDERVDLSTWTSGDRSSPDAVTYRATAIDGTTVTLDASPQGLAAGDEVLILDVQGGPGAGAYTFATLASVTSTLTLTEAAPAFDTTHTVLVVRVPNYTDVTIGTDGVLTTARWDGDTGGVLAFRATGTVHVGGGITTSELGYRGGDTGSGYNCDAYQGESWTGLGGGGNCSGYNETTGEWAPNGGGGGAHITGAGGEHAGGATGGDSWDDYATPPEPGESYGDAALTTIAFGSGGGGVWNDGNVGAGPGGAGGGIVFVAAATIEVEGSVSATGETAVSWSTGNWTYGAGGGAGGTIWLQADTLVASDGALDARGGAGQTDYIRWGGDGGEGRVRLDCGTLNGGACSLDSAEGVSTPAPGFVGGL